jgi:hypothetical protein
MGPWLDQTTLVYFYRIVTDGTLGTTPKKTTPAKTHSCQIRSRLLRFTTFERLGPGLEE